MNLLSHIIDCALQGDRFCLKGLLLCSSMTLSIGLALMLMLLSSCGPSRASESVLQIESDSVYTSLSEDATIQSGYEVYRTYGCVLCHGVNGGGGVTNKNAQTAEEIPSLTYTAEGFTTDEFRQKVLHGVTNIAKLDSTGVTPPYAMPGWDKINESELSDLTLYVWNLLPEGEEDDW